MERKMVEFKAVNYHYSHSKRFALRNVSFALRAGTWTSLVGPNGSGKSTLVKLMDGLLPLTHGQIFIDGLPVNHRNLAKVRSKVGLIFQDPDDQFVFPDVEDDLAFGLENRDVPRSKMVSIMNASLSAVGMLSYKDALLSELSGGQKQRIALAEVIATRPRILVLDESVSMLDPVSRRQILELINDLHHRFRLTVLMITHDISEVRYSDRLILLNGGKIIASGRPQLILSNLRLLRAAKLPKPNVMNLINQMRKHGLMVPKTVHSRDEVLKWLLQFY